MRALIKLIQKTYKMIEHPGSKKGLHNVISLSGLQVISYILPIIILPYLFRVIGAEKFGLIAFAQAFVQYFCILTDYGFSVSATKEIALCLENKIQVRRVIAAVMTVKLVLVLFSFVILGGIVYFAPKFRSDWVIYVLSFGAVVGGSLFPSWFFQGTERMKYTAILSIFGQYVYASLIFIFIHGRNDYLLVPVITSIVSLLTGLGGQYIILTRFDIPFQLPEFREIRHQLKEGWNVFISDVAINAYTITRIFAVGLLTNNTLTGYYSIAEKIANAVQTFPLSSFSQAIFPRLSKIFNRNKTRAFEIMQQVQLITIIISLIFLPVIFLLAPWIVRLVCGGVYPATVLSLRFLLISIFFISSNAFRVQFLLVCGETKTYSRIHISMAMIGLPLIIIFIYCFSYVGAAMATAIIEGGVFTITYLIIKKLKF
ncbi:MAG: flippase [Candidatus Omnitrophica bacterium]|nr:flippase [Candidatus Omnitrophota bacterium]